MLRLSGSLPEPDRDAVFTTVLVRDGRPRHWDRHEARLAASAHAVLGTCLPADLAERVLRAGADAHRLRVRMACDVGVTVEAGGSAVPLPGPRHLVTVTGRTGPWDHKWCDRRQIAAAEELVGPGRMPVFADEAGHLLETSTGNLVVVRGDRLSTPPLSADLLPGVTREVLLERAAGLGLTVDERPLTAADLGGACAFTTSSLAGVVPVATLDGHAVAQDDALLQRLRTAVEPDTDPAP